MNLVHAMWIILTGAMVAGACGVLGSFLVLRRMSLLGDAISHAVLPGIAFAFLITDSRATLPMLVGAGILGVFTSFLIETLEKSARVQKDAAIGITFTALFSIGVIVIALAADRVDLDQECVLYGEIMYVPLDDHIELLGLDLGPRQFVWMALVFAIDIAFVVVFWKELVVASFDAELARSMGFNASLVHYLLMGMVSVTVVAAFESVGAILVVAMLIVPGATAHLLTDRLSVMLVIAASLGAVSSAIGYVVAAQVDASISGSIAAAAGFLFALAFLLAPRQGIVSRAIARALLRLRIATENLLAELYRLSERGEQHASATSIATKLGWARALTRITLWNAERRGFVEQTALGLRLLAPGLDEASRVRNAHRAWQSELESMGYDRPHAHASAHRLEHVASPNAVRTESAAI